MSASLVGSEMCIRDSGSVVAYAHGMLVRWPWTGSFHESCGHALRDAVTVSYTHLTLPTICSV
eukprot:1360589-Alexandrium_andersonii.AAC.1